MFLTCQIPELLPVPPFQDKIDVSGRWFQISPVGMLKVLHSFQQFEHFCQGCTECISEYQVLRPWSHNGPHNNLKNWIGFKKFPLASTWYNRSFSTNYLLHIASWRSCEPVWVPTCCVSVEMWQVPRELLWHIAR